LALHTVDLEVRVQSHHELVGFKITTLCDSFLDLLPQILSR
jgi:hypothetical protein